jgi:hypothetical protein
VVAEWTALIESYTRSLESVDTEPTQPPVINGGNTSSTPDNGRGRVRPRGPLSVDEIIARLDALSIEQEELRSMLQYADRGGERRGSGGASARASPSQNTAHLVDQTHPSEPEFSRAGQGQTRVSSSSRDSWRRVFGRRA